MTDTATSTDGAASGYSMGSILPSGTWMPVMNLAEQRYLEDKVERYNDHNQLVNISDLSELDRLIILELLVYRLSTWIGQGEDYAGEEINDRLHQEQIKYHSSEIRLIKKNLGMDRPARERAKGEGSIAHYWANLQTRAKAFGVMRVKQLGKALELTNELISLIQVHDNCVDDEERELLHCTRDEIFGWIRDTYTPEFQAIDTHFRENEQTFWVRAQ